LTELEDRTIQQVRHDLIEAERVSALESSADVSFAAFIMSGLELEDAQYV